MTKTIVLATLEQTGMRETGRMVRRDMNWFPEYEACSQAVACIWLNEGDDEDVKNARAYARENGYVVMTFATDHPDPLGAAKAALMA